MSYFHLVKYPVISKSGQEYRVDVCDDRIYGGHVVCGIFKAIEKRTIFGNRKTSFKQLNSTSIMRNIYDEEKWNYDYVAIALSEIEEYEKTIQDLTDRKRKRSEGARKFEEWDGKSHEV